MRIKWLWILCGIYAIAWGGTCTEVGSNDLKCDSVTSDSDSYTYKLESNKNLSQNTISVSGGNLTINFSPIVTRLTTTISLQISGGTMSINCELDDKGQCKDSRASFDLQGNNSIINISGNGKFQSAFVVNTTGNINVSGGEFLGGLLQNNKSVSLSGGKLNLGMLENSGTTDFKGGSSTITSLLNTANFTISSGEHKIGSLSNEKGTTTISGGKNTIDLLMNNDNLIISGGTNNNDLNTIMDFRNQKGTTTISGGTNTITNLSNTADLTISGGTNTITTFSNTKGTATISGGTNNIAELLNTANLTLKNGGDTTIKTYFNNSGTATLELNSTLKLESTANFNNYGTLSGDGTISGGIFNHYGKFENFSGTFNGDLSFNNFANLTIKKNGGSGDLASFNVKNFGNYYANSTSKLTLESSITTQGFTNGILASFVVKSGGKLTINAGGTQTISCDNNNPNCHCTGGQTTCTINLVAQNAGGFFTLESGGQVDSNINFSNTGYLTINGGDFNVNSKALKNEGNGVIALKDGTIKGNVENISGSFNMSGGTIENTLKNNGNFTLSGGTISGAITNEGGNFAISGGVTSADFTNKARTIQNKDENDNVISTDYKGANLIILGNVKIDSLTNESQNGTNSVISIEGGNLASTTLTNAGLFQAISGNLNVTNSLNNNGGIITAYSGGNITAQSFQWGNGIVNYINGNSGLLDFKTINDVSTDSKLNMNFLHSPLVFGQEYKVIKTNSTNAISFTVTSNVESNLQNSENLKFNKSYKDGYIVISTVIDNAKAPLRTLLSTSALQTLGDTTDQFDALKRLDSSEVLSNIISNPTKVVTELKNSNEQVATNHTKNSHLNLATSLNTLNRLNKHSTPQKLAFSDMLKPNYQFSRNYKNPLIRFANFDNSNIESVDDNATFTLEDFKKEYDEEVEAAKLKYNQLVDYANNLYASIFGIFGNFGGIKTNAYGLIAGYDTKVSDRLIMGANLSYANTNKAHNIGIGGYGRAFVLNNEIDFGVNFNYALTEYATQILGYTQSAKFSSFGINANVEYGYLFNVYKTQFFKPFGGLNLYYAATPNYKESGKYGRAVDSQHSFEMSFDLGAEYRIFLKKYYYLFAQIKFEQFVLNASNGLNMSFVGDGEKFEFAKYKGYKNYLQFLIGGDFAVIRDMLNITANVGYKMTIAKSSVDGHEIGESYISANVGIKYLF